MSARGQPTDSDRSTVTAAVQVLSGDGQQRPWFRRISPFLGPALVASVAYVDPGNFATNLEAGARLGYRLLWVVVVSNVMAVVIQTLSAKLGIATGHNLAEHCRLHLPRSLNGIVWAIMELAAMATDLAEFLGAALGFHLLFGIPLGLAGVLTAVATFLLLGMERYGFRRIEAVITVLVVLIAGCYLLELVLARPDWRQIARHAVVPSFGGPQGLLLAAGILGATVMPHVVFLHSALTQGRIVLHDQRAKRRLLRFEFVDVLLAMGLAGAINAAILIMAAAVFPAGGVHGGNVIENAYLTLQPLLGRAAGTIFAISLLAAGLSSSTVGTMSGQVIMQGFLRRQLPLWLRRGITMAPALVVILLGLDPTRTLIISQVVLSFALPFAIVPLVVFTSRRTIMGDLVNHKATTVVALAIAALIVGLNAYLLVQTLGGS